MKKSDIILREFVKPEISVVELQPSEIIASSDSQIEDIHTGADGNPIDISDNWILKS